MRIRGTTALVTGASSGIGEATALALAAEGATVVGVARRAELLDEVMRRCSALTPGAVPVVGDLSTAEGCAQVLEVAIDTAGDVDVLVNNAGVSLRKHITRTSVEEIERVTELNYLAAVRLTMGLLPGMVERRSGSVINVTSVAGYLPNPLESAYGASKAALHLWTHGVAVDLHGTGVHVGVVNPGPIDTGMWASDEEAPAYHGRLYPASAVADGIVTSIRRGTVHRTVPRHFGMPPMMYPVLGRAMRWGLRTFESRGEAKGDPREQR